MSKPSKAQLAPISNPKPVKAAKPEPCPKCGAEPAVQLYEDGSVAEERLKCKHVTRVKHYEPQEMGLPAKHDRVLVFDKRIPHDPIVDE